jgi:hypothetical protein
MNSKANKFTDRSYREWPSISLEYNHQSANPAHGEMLYLQEDDSKFGRGNVHIFPQGGLINSYPVPSRKASIGPLPFANWHSTQVLMGIDLDVTGDPSASPKCVTGQKVGWPSRDPIVNAPYQTRSRQNDSAGSQDVGSVVFAEYIKKDLITSSEYPTAEGTRTNPLEQENPDDENLVKEQVSSLGVRNTSHARRKVKARFTCFIKDCGGTFTRKKNLECE